MNLKNYLKGLNSYKLNEVINKDLIIKLAKIKKSDKIKLKAINELLATYKNYDNGNFEGDTVDNILYSILDDMLFDAIGDIKTSQEILDLQDLVK